MTVQTITLNYEGLECKRPNKQIITGAITGDSITQSKTNLLSLLVSNIGLSGFWLQMHDASAVPAFEAAATFPSIFIPGVNAETNVFMLQQPLQFQNGLVLIASLSANANSPILSNDMMAVCQLFQTLI